MKRTMKWIFSKWTFSYAAAALMLVACGDNTVTPGSDASITGGDTIDSSVGSDTGTGTTTDPVQVDVSAPITKDTTWTPANRYRLKQHIFVEGGTLTIEPGVTIIGDRGSSLVVTSGGKLNAVGTAQKPIVFTSAAPVGSRAPGDWGGVVLLGLAPINISGNSEKIEGFSAAEGKTTYGGNKADHHCGSIKYARIEFAGFELAPDNELNGLTLGGCGSATEVDYVQVHRGADDGVEVFGGTVNLKHILITQPDDDGLDWDYGWQGKAQFLVVQQNALVGNYGIEADNNNNNNDADPRSMPHIWNATLIGSGAQAGKAGKLQSGMLLRRGTAGEFGNVIVSHFADGVIDVDGDSSVAQAKSEALSIKGSVFFDNAQLTGKWPEEKKDNDSGFEEGKHFTDAKFNNRAVDPMLTDAKNLLKPNFLPKSGSPVLAGTDNGNSANLTPPNDAFFDKNANFVGAMGDVDWTASWSAFPAN